MRQGVVQRADAPHNWSFGGHWVGAALGLDRIGMGCFGSGGFPNRALKISMTEIFLFQEGVLVHNISANFLY